MPVTRSRTGQLYDPGEGNLGDVLSDAALPLSREFVREDLGTAHRKYDLGEEGPEPLMFRREDFMPPTAPMAPAKRLARPFQAEDPDLSIGTPPSLAMPQELKQGAALGRPRKVAQARPVQKAATTKRSLQRSHR